MGENRLVVSKWRAVSKNTLLGFADVELPNGLLIHDISVHEKNGRRWTAMPATARIDDGRQRVVDGKAQWKKILEWRSRDLSERFAARLIEAIQDQHPGSLR